MHYHWSTLQNTLQEAVATQAPIQHQYNHVASRLELAGRMVLYWGCDMFRGLTHLCVVHLQVEALPKVCHWCPSAEAGQPTLSHQGHSCNDGLSNSTCLHKQGKHWMLPETAEQIWCIASKPFFQQTQGGTICRLQQSASIPVKTALRQINRTLLSRKGCRVSAQVTDCTAEHAYSCESN